MASSCQRSTVATSFHALTVISDAKLCLNSSDKDVMAWQIKHRDSDAKVLRNLTDGELNIRSE